MKYSTLNLTACPIYHNSLAYAGADAPTLHAGPLICSHCKRDYPIVEGIPYFVICRAQEIKG